MKKLLLIPTFLTLFLTSSVIAWAASPTPNQNINGLEQQINNLKDRIASRVAQLNLVEKRGIIGVVTDVSENQITINDMDGNTRFIDVDELTKFSSPSAKSNFGISDITKNSTIGALGLYNKDSRRLLARFVDVQIFPQIISGGVADLDNTNYTLDVLTAEGKTYTVEVEDITKTSSYTKASGLVKSGFSKIQQAERIMVIGFWDKSDSSKIIASRVIIFPDLPLNPKITITKSTEVITPSPTPATKKATSLSK